MPTTEIEIEVERYAYPRRFHKFKIPAYVVGSLAVHRAAFWGEGEPPAPAELCRGDWTATHMATGMQLGSGIPGHVRTTRKALVAWARRLQDAQPEFFAALDANPDAWRATVAQSRETVLRACIEAGRGL